ncbi:hypothetical protein EDB89DRAFT_246098 [Lactarius sanguifluus]|nr:hypothetical protein EDB89DRAFT_246098 [Lactarius sanguifluus]
MHRALVASTVQESASCDRLLGFLRGHAPRVRIVGDAHNGTPTISFVVRGTLSRDVVRACDATGTRLQIGIRYGLVDELIPKIVINDGVVRVSLGSITTRRTKWIVSSTY